LLNFLDTSIVKKANPLAETEVLFKAKENNE